MNISALPYFIREDKHYKDKPFKKIFPLIGARNFTIPIKSIKQTKNYRKIADAIFLASRQLPSNRWYGLLNRGLSFSGCKIYNALDFFYYKSARNYFSNYEVVFSSDGEKGMWDIATMSMRGIHSCMNWDGSRAAALIGSIIDPCCGIIYLKDKNSDQMLVRCVVRYVYSETLEQEALFLENAYWVEEDDDIEKHIGGVVSLFQRILFSKTRLPVLSFLDTDIELNCKFFIPKASILNETPKYQRSYIDSKLKYRDLFPNIKPYYHYYPSEVAKKSTLTKLKLFIDNFIEQQK